MESLLEEVYTGRVTGTNKKALYSINDRKKSCKRLTPITFEYVMDSVDDLTEDLIQGNLSMLEAVLKKKQMKGTVSKVLKTIKVGKALLFSSSIEGIAVIDRIANTRTNLVNGEEIENFIKAHKEKMKLDGANRRQRGKSNHNPPRNYVKEKQLLDKFRHLLPK